MADAHWGEEKLDFVDFMSAMVTFALFGDRELLQYCFYIFDVDNSGAISRNELRDLIAGVRKYDATDGNSPKIEEYLEKLHASLDADGDGFINFTEFTHMNTIMPSVLSPAKSMQLKIQLRLFGSEFWVKRQRELMGYRGRKAMAAAQRAAASMLEHRTNRYNMVLQIRRGCCAGATSVKNRLAGAVSSALVCVAVASARSIDQGAPKIAASAPPNSVAAGDRDVTIATTGPYKQLLATAQQLANTLRCKPCKMAGAAVYSAR